MWSTWTESAKTSLTQALEKTGDVISRAATDAGKSARTQPVSSASSGGSAILQSRTVTDDGKQDLLQESTIPSTSSSSSSSVVAAAAAAAPDLFKSLSSGWNTVIETTKASIQTAELAVKETVKEHQQFFQDKLAKARVAYYKRDPSLPLDVDALKDAEVVYITDRIITMGHPALASQFDGEITGERKLAAIGHLLNRRHAGHYMVWNLSELQYDIDILDDQVLTFSFPGSPSPPLGLLLKLLVSMESWLKADDQNVAVVHCLTGKGRTSTVLAAFLCWMGEAGFSNINDALEYIATCKQISPDDLTIPSQRRYSSYFKNMLDGVHPSQPPLMLKRIIMSEAPKYARGPLRKENGKEPTEEELRLAMGCVPYIQIFKAGKLLRTVPASLHFQQAENELPFCAVSDGSISFHINLVVQGDILIRARHLTPNRRRISMFRAAFHTGYVPPKVMRLTKSQLDGACADDRFPAEFFLDLIFEPADAEAAGKLLQEVNEASSEHPHVETKQDANETSIAAGGSLIAASAYDSMLHRDSRFWDAIAARKVLLESKEQSSTTTAELDDMFGPTVGRRRAFTTDGQPTSPAAAQKQVIAAGELESFSIGGELDFLPAVIHPETDGERVPKSSTPATGERKKDSLMEALMGALDEDIDDHEMVIFDNTAEGRAFLPGTRMLDNPSESTNAPVQKKEQTTINSDSATDIASVSKSTSSTQICTPTIVQLPPLPPREKQESVAVTESSSTKSKDNNNNVDDDVTTLMQDVDKNMNVDDDLDALLGEANALTDQNNANNHNNNDKEEEDDDDILNLDIDDAELADLENFLNKV